MGIVASSAVRMRDLLKDVLLYLETRKEPLVLEQVSIGDLVSKLVRSDRRFGKDLITLSVSEMPLIQADYTQLSLLFTQLVLNSLQHSRKNSVQILLSGKVVEERLVVTFKDNGVGLAPEFAERAFGLFQRVVEANDLAEVSSMTVNSGTGIGLSLCREIVERHGGQIWFDVVTDGCSLSFSLPCSNNIQTSS
jgi:light-regulated signal transduction histidine kinase (bacteriophytochrome)